MKRTEKKKLVLTKRDLRALTVLTTPELQQVAGASGNKPGGCGGSSNNCPDQF
jgi:hypothetical protein